MFDSDDRLPPPGIIVGQEKSLDPQRALESFKHAPIKNVRTLPIEIVHPSQKDDGVRNYSSQPINVFLEPGRKGQEDRIVIDTGNHRYFTRLGSGDQMIQVRKVENPYTSW
jgi:hypothetical protein